LNSVPGSDGATLSQLASLSMLRQPRSRVALIAWRLAGAGFVAMTLLLAVLPFRADFAIAYAEGPLQRYRPGNRVGSADRDCTGARRELRRVWPQESVNSIAKGQRWNLPGWPGSWLISTSRASSAANANG